MKKNHWICILSVMLLAMCLSACAPRPLVTGSTIGAISSKNRILIATKNSEFKDAVVSRIVKALEKEKVFIEIIDLANLSNISSKGYEAIVIMNEYKFFRINRHVRHFLESTSEYDRKKIVLLTTAGSPSIMVKGAEVDAISSASKNANAGSVSEKIIRKVDAILAE